MKVNVLGTEYEVILNGKEQDYPRLRDGDGYCDTSIKRIVVAEMIPNERYVKDLKSYERKVVRHELIHAFMYESGLDINSEWGRDETLIDWIAIQSPKMIEVFDQLEV